MNTTIKIIIDGKPLANNMHSVYLRIIKNRKKKLINLGLKCLKENFQNEQFLKKHPDYKIENELLLNLKMKANKAIRTLQINEDEFTLDDFELEFKGINKEEVYVAQFFDEIIEEMNTAGRTGNAKAYSDTKSSVIGYSSNKLRFKEITPTFLEKYEVYLRQRKNKDAGIAFKMRELRALFNKAIERNIVSKEKYPFSVYKISKFKVKRVKKSLTVEEFRRIKNLDLTEHPNLINAHNFFMFSIYTRGMNFMDMMLLKWGNIQDNRILYTRSKTKVDFNIDTNVKVREILDYYKSQNRKTDFVFPILLKNDLSHMQIANRKHKVLGRYNSQLKDIGDLAKIEKKITSYVARHSFATLLKNSGTSIDKISEMMGHSNVDITMSYLKNFESEILDLENEKLINL